MKKWKWKSLSYLREVSLADAFRQAIDGYLGTIELLRLEIDGLV